ncbi:MAG: MYXO-CTERM sorting domain-containing protein, partial [Myxococcales bacterium]
GDGCACAQASGSATLFGLALLGGLLRRRRLPAP